MNDVYHNAATYNAHGQQDSAANLIDAHLPLVRKTAWHIHSGIHGKVEIEDLVQIGMLALVEAAHGFEDRGYGFTNYAKLRVRGAMVDHLRQKSHLTRSNLKFRKDLARATMQLEMELGRAPDEVEVAQALNMAPSEFRQAHDMAQNITEMDMDDAYSDQNIWFMDNTPRADDAMEQAEMRQMLAKAIGQLPERQAMVLQLYFVEEMNLDEIGQALSLGAARICQIKKQALEQVKKIMTEKYS